MQEYRRIATQTPASTVAGELLTGSLIVGTYTAWVFLTLFWRDIPLPLLVPMAGCTLALFGSLQHEAIHGHPTTCRRINLALVWVPLSIWLPLTVYESSHRAHHLSDLTQPGNDPESWYVPNARWRLMSKGTRALWRFNQTFLGRMLVGPWISVYALWRELVNRLTRNASSLGVIATHLAGVAGVLWWVSTVAGMPLHVYLAAFVWPGISLTLVRSFVEHRYDDVPGHRTAIVRGGPLTRLLFLNNNFHVVHHRQPELAWYLIPRFYERHSAEIQRLNGGYCFDGYGSIARRYFLTPWTPPEFPRADSRAGDRPDMRRAPSRQGSAPTG
ncbi:MAG: fatty acid desaturase [Proteobacteria bacterium]|nr:MAG: fatty acid desaturase [Pseudomonadota bacterium]